VTDPAAQTADTVQSDALNEHRRLALAKIETLREQGTNPYPHDYPDRTMIDSVRQTHDGLEADQETDAVYRVAGRIVARRQHGALVFLDLEDDSAAIQLLADQDHLGDAFEFAQGLGVGDIIGVGGAVLRTARGELSLRPTEITLLAKSILPFPDRKSGIKDPELRQRKRELELMSIPETRERFRARARVISAIRQVMDGEGFIEVETPILQNIYGGASATPFVTHHRALGQDFYLRIAPELYLKRCLVGGLERVYEIGRDFRNEGLSPKHNPEFSMIECYQAYADYNDSLELFKKLIAAAAIAVNGSSEITLPSGTYDTASDWKVITYRQAMMIHTGIDIEDQPTLAQLEAAMPKGQQLPKNCSAEDALDKVFSKRVESELKGLTIIKDYPAVSTPLAKRHRDDPELVERFEAFADDVELANSFSELNDPVEQRHRFEEQAGDQGYDQDFIASLEQAMPPAAGIGIGIDRLVAMITGSENIREIILFPTLKNRDQS